MWEKIKDFFGYIGTYVAIILGAIGGIFFATRRTSDDFDRLRADNEQLRESIEQLRKQLDAVRNINESNKEQYQSIGSELYNIDRIVERTREDIDGQRGDVEQLRDTNQRLREWISKYGKEIETLDGGV